MLWGRATNGRTTIYWARVTPAGTSAIRVVTATDVDSAMDKANLVLNEDPADHLVRGFADPLRYCPECTTETSFDPDGSVVFVCPTDAAHLTVRPV